MTRAHEPQPERVIALRYEHNSERAPEVTAKGEGALARRILEVAAEHDVPVREDIDLVQLLAACELGDEVPVELFGAVAALFAYLYGLNQELAAAPLDSQDARAPSDRPDCR